ncbi:DUF3558 domain-containing protein [Saccharopolyspora hattusasensis]|uniref:DUF3558 domain-containing protein n=1 Tax=Saccharopolyspora hattusasensis TaxID=1128679 RepID=UPI003D95DEB9
MKTKLIGLKRSTVIAASALVVGGLAACSGPDSSGGEPPRNPPQETATGPKVSDPRDPSAVDLCSLLPADKAVSLGYEGQGKVLKSPSPDSPETCSWGTADRNNTVSLAPIKDRSIQDYYDNKSKFVDFQELTISGHPAVRANKGDPAKDGWCSIYLATTDSSLLYAFARDSSKADACGIAQKALEASVPTLPAAR